MNWDKDDVREVIGTNSEETVGLYLLGTVDVAEASKMIKQYARENGFDKSDIEDFPKPKHERWRRVPTRKSFVSCIFQRDASGRGAFPVTHVEVQKW